MDKIIISFVILDTTNNIGNGANLYFDNPGLSEAQIKKLKCSISDIIKKEICSLLDIVSF